MTYLLLVQSSRWKGDEDYLKPKEGIKRFLIYKSSKYNKIMKETGGKPELEPRCMLQGNERRQQDLQLQMRSFDTVLLDRSN